MEPALLRNSPAHPSALLISVHISLKGDLFPFTVGFLPSGFAPPEASVDDKAGRNRRGKSQEQRDKEKKSWSPLNANMVFLKHSINPSCPPCQAQMGNGKGDIIIIMSHSCRFKHPDDILQNKQRSRARPGGLALTSKTRSWRERENSKEMCSPSPWQCCCFCLLEQLRFSILNEWWQERGIRHSLCAGTHPSGTLNPLLPVSFIK